MSSSSAILLGARRLATMGRLSAGLRTRPAAIHTRTVRTAAASAASATSTEDGFSSRTTALLAAAAVGIVGAVAAKEESNDKASCAAIAAVVGNKDLDARKFLIEGLTKMKTRGYDGAGFATMTPAGANLNIVKRSKTADSPYPIDTVRDQSRSIDGHSVGIAHSRWATHGAMTDANAHPHTDGSGKIAISHNGAIFNSRELRKELLALGHHFEGTTDTEVVAKLIGHYRDTEKLTVRDATERAMKRCEGTWGLVVMCSDTPEELIVTSHGSPLFIGVGDNGTFVASDPKAFKDYSRNFIKLDDREVATITVDGRNLDLTTTLTAPDEDEKGSPSPYPHWFLKEVSEQPQAIGRALCFGGRLSIDTATLGGLEAKYDLLKGIEHMSIVGCGSSFNAAMYGTKLLRHTGAFTNVFAMDANSMEESDLRVSDPTKSGLIVCSQSGETKDIIDVAALAMRKNVPTMSVVNDVGSTLANMTKCGVYSHAGVENATASTKSFTAEVVCLALMALWFKQVRAQERGVSLNTHAENALAESLQRLPITFGMLMKTRDVCKIAAQKLETKEHCFVLGKGFGEPIAMEGALKLKEVGYLHAEGYSGGALKHGPFAMIEDENGKLGNTPIIMIVLDDNHANHMRTACEEVKARGAELIIITDKRKLAEGLCDDPIIIPSNGPLTALGAVIPLQLIAYELALLKGNNPDSPRNLLKTFTMD